MCTDDCPVGALQVDVCGSFALVARVVGQDLGVALLSPRLSLRLLLQKSHTPPL